MTRLKACSALLITSLGTTAAHADVFAFKDLEGFEKCLRTDHVVESVKTDKGAQKRWLSEVEIQVRCIESAAKLLAPQKNKDIDLAFIGTAKRLSAQENSLDLINVLVDHTLAGCNELAAYEVMTKSLSRPSDASKSSVFGKAKIIVKRCLKDKTFKTDFMEEKDHPDSYLGPNACQILLEEKLVKSCKASK
jgi:hypothetical protein